MSEQLQNQIYYLCNRFHEVEWSGTVFYKVESGDFGEDNCVIFCHSLYLHDVGSSTYTEYEFGPDYFAFLMKNPELMKLRIGHIHSHNRMDVGSSRVDLQACKLEYSIVSPK